MNIVFWLLVILITIIIWFFCSFIFKPLGKYLFRLWKDTVENMEIDEKDEEETK